MITTNYQTYGTSGFNLRLRIYQDGETRYVNVNKLLHGQLYKRHWNQKKQLFIPSAPFSKENNKWCVARTGRRLRLLHRIKTMRVESYD